MKHNSEQPKAPDANPGTKPEPKDDLKSLPVPEVEKQLAPSSEGLTEAEAQKRLITVWPQPDRGKEIESVLEVPHLFLGAHPVHD
jgi:H+-transporting ATPase